MVRSYRPMFADHSLLTPMHTAVSAIRSHHKQDYFYAVARKLTNKLLEIFPNDPLKADFALFGYGVNQE